MRIHCIQHVPFEGPGIIEDWALKQQTPISYTRVFGKDDFPDIHSFDFLLLMGGPMSVTEEEIYPWLKAEKQLVRDSISAGKKVLGICLGAQMIASALGEKITRIPDKEIGWFPVNFTSKARKNKLLEHFPETTTVFHWHGEQFEIPEEAVLIGSSKACMNQGFIIGEQVVGLQFHLEETPQSLLQISESCRAELIPGTYVQEESFFNAQAGLAYAANTLLQGLLDRMAVNFKAEQSCCA